MMPLHSESRPVEHQPLTSHTTNAPEVMSFANTKFIGAVEDEWQLFSDRPEDYTIGEPIGFGASSIVYLANYRPVDQDGSTDLANGIPCALKVLDLDSLPPRSLYLLQRETTLMSLSKHPNVLRVRGSWIAGHHLYIALRLMNKGSAADVMRYGWPGGMQEEVVRCILRQALKGLNYLHINSFIHRDIKAANLLVDDDGTVLLGDLGVAADLAEEDTTPGFKSSITSSSVISQVNSGAPTNAMSGQASGPIRPRMGKRKSFVGTPCWMAPELIQGKRYDAKADIWSFGITALELTQGRPPRSRESPQRVLLRIIQEDAPNLDRKGGAHNYSRAFKEVVDWCLNKDPAKRPTAEELLQTPFFRGSKKKSYLINAILKDLPPLSRRQERRPLPLVTSATSIDSWDFATTVHSSRTINRPRCSIDHEDFTGDTIFVMDEEDKHIVTHAADTEESDIELDAGPSSATTPASSLRSCGLDVSSLKPCTSTPSSYTDASEMSHRTQPVKLLTSEARNIGEPLASIAEQANQHAAVASRQPPTTHNPKSIPVAISFSDSSSNSGHRRNLWQRLKTNVRRSSSSDGRSRSRDSSPSKGRMSGMLQLSAISSKGLSTGNSSPN